MRTSVVVVSCRSHSWLEPCLTSILHQADEVILVDNGSPASTVGRVGRQAGAVVVRLPKNRGFAAGVNAGLQRARGDLVGLLNDDAVASGDWLATAASSLEAQDVAAVGPKVLFAGLFVELRLDSEPRFAPGDPRPLGRSIGRIEVGGIEIPLSGLLGPGVHELERKVDGADTHQWRWTSGSGEVFVPVPVEANSLDVVVDGEPVDAVQTVDVVANAGSYLSTHGHGGDCGFGAPDDGRFDAPVERFATTGAAMVARAETFARMGGFNESYFAYYEDLDWCWRARLAGMRCLYEPASVVRHVGGLSSGGRFNDQVRYLAARNRMQTLARNAPLSVVWSQLRSPADRPSSGITGPIMKRVSVGLTERRRLARIWSTSPRDVWTAWAGKNENELCPRAPTPAR